MRVSLREDGASQRWARLDEVAEGQLPIETICVWEPSSVWDGAVERLLRFIGEYVEESGRRIRARETMDYGWTILRASGGEAAEAASVDVLTLEELASPLEEEATGYAPGVWRALRLLEAQFDVLRRNQVSGLAQHPSRNEGAIICSRASLTGDSSLFLERLEANKERRSSGWVVRCIDSTHDHDDADQLLFLHLSHIVHRCPRVLPYLALPEGSAVLFDGNKTVLFNPGEDKGRLDPDPEAWRAVTELGD
jgi:hypothetical protein